MAEHTNNTNTTTNVGGAGVPGAQVELMDTLENLQPQSHQHLQQQQYQQDVDYAHQVQQHANQQQQQPFYQQEPVVRRDQRQFDQQYQQSFFSQPNDGGGVQINSATMDAEMAAPAVVPANTNAVGDGAPGFSVGGVGVPGARVELMDSMQPQSHYQQQQERHVQQQSTAAPVQAQQSFFSQPGDSSSTHQQYNGQENTAPAHYTGVDATNFHAGGLGAPGAHVEYLPTIAEQQRQTTTTSANTTTGTGTQPGELDTVQHASASRPPVGPFDPPAQSDASTAPPTIFLQREASSITTPQVVAAPQKIHVASSGAVAAAAAAQAADASSRGRRRSSLAVLADKIRSSTSRSHSRSHSRSSSISRRLSRTISRHSFDGEEEDTTAGGPYRDVKIAQQEHLAKLRAEQEKNGITHNVDGLPIPPAPERQRRRSSVSHILGLDKPLLSR
ncbi:hypothetical protein BGX24_000195 [Mortierella sp. AD032]|nr:hypothetical protein BGX24_000195 [Mortierella sp. AD032]